MAISGPIIERRKRLKRWLSRFTLTGLALLIAAIGYAFYLQVATVLALQDERSRLNAEFQVLNRENQALMERLSLKDDPDYLEYLARKELGLIKPDEVKYILPPDIP